MDIKKPGCLSFQLRHAKDKLVHTHIINFAAIPVSWMDFDTTMCFHLQTSGYLTTKSEMRVGAKLIEGYWKAI
jgi:hypothetical protein